MSIDEEIIEKNEADKIDIFSDGFEVIYEGELPEPEPDLGADSYKDVLSKLSELDDTGAVDIDYLEANRTRTIRFSDTSLSSGEKTSEPQESQITSQSTEISRKDKFVKIFFAVVFIIISAILMLLASRIY